jgi:hypothetical protein
MDPEQRQSVSYTSKYAYLSSLYFIAVGVLYLWGYWPTFEVNILEYAGLTDIIKTAAYPIASLFVFFALGAVMGEFLAHGDALPPGGGVNTPTGRVLRRIAPYVVVAYLAVTLLLFFFGPTEKWRILPVLVALPLYLVARRYEVLADVIAHDKVRSTLIFLLAALPFFAYGHGRLKAAAIMSGEEYTVTMSPIPGLSLGTEPIERRPRYLGVAGDNAFFYLPEHRSTVVAVMGELKVLELARHKTKAQSEDPAPADKKLPPQDAQRSATPLPGTSR